jgi:D-alanine-D-alanine ligase
MYVGMTYDLKDDYLRQGYSELDTAEFDGVETVEAIENCLLNMGHQVCRIGNVQDLTRALASGERWDMVFNIAEGLNGFGREAQVPALLDAFGIPYTFSDPLVCALTLHKEIAKHVVRAHGVPTPDSLLVETLEDLQAPLPAFPLFAKPVAEGTSKGITHNSRINSLGALRKVCARLLKRYDQPVLVERFLPGREFTVGILGTGAQARTVGTLEVNLNPGADAEIYSYRNKQEWRELVTYALLEEPLLRDQVEAVALAAWNSLGCRDGGRVDIRLDDQGVPNFIEVNPLAGLNPRSSDLPILAGMRGLPYASLIHAIFESACERIPVSRQRAVA